MQRLSVRIDQRLREVEGWWKLQCFLKRSLLLLVCVTLLVLALGSAMVAGWITHPIWAVAGLVSVILLSLFAGLLIAMISFVPREEPQWLAASLEKSRTDLMDRLNTLVYLQGRRDDSSLELSQVLEQEIDQVLQSAPTGCPFPWTRLLRPLISLAVALLATIAFYSYFQPISRLQAATVPPIAEEELAGLDIPETEGPRDPSDRESENVVWGELRIVEPGRDLKVTTLDLIPLQIEAATNQNLSQVEWLTLISGGPTEHHGLPAPDHPHYVVYRPSLLIEDFGLQEWDVMSYFARAETQEGDEYRSVEYFVEVVPPRPELEKLPAPAFETLEELTGLIEWQEEIIRETGRLSQLRDLDKGDLRNRQQDLATQSQQVEQAVQHLAARMSQRFDDDAIAGMTEKLQAAATALQDTQQQPTLPPTAEAEDAQRVALERLADARKHFHQRVQQNPAAFEGSAEEFLAQQRRVERAPTDSRQPFEEFQTKLDEQQQALTDSQDKLELLIKRQRMIEFQSEQIQNEQWNKLAVQEGQLAKDLQDFTERLPDPEESMQPAADAAQQALQQAQAALESKDQPAARQETSAATAQLEALDELLSRQGEDLKLAEQMLLEERLRQNREQYRQIEEQSQATAPDELQRTTEETNDILDQLLAAAAQPPAKDPAAESPEPPPSPLQQELTQEKRDQLAAQVDNLSQQPEASGQSEQAAEIGKRLDQLSEALQREVAQQSAGRGQAKQEQQLRQQQASEDQLAQARHAVQAALAEQREIERGISPAANENHPQLEERQSAANETFDKAVDQNPQGFSECQSQAAGAQKAMRLSQRSLQLSAPMARQHAREAAEELQALDSALEQQQQLNQMADAYRQKELLDQQIEQLRRMEQQPESASPSQCQSSGGACKSLTGAMQSLMQQPGMAEAFGPQMQQALNEENKQQLDQQSDALANSKTPGEVQAAAGELRQSLEQLAKAFESGAANPGLAGQMGSSLKPSGQQAIAEGLRRLESES